MGEGEARQGAPATIRPFWAIKYTDLVVIGHILEIPLNPP